MPNSWPGCLSFQAFAWYSSSSGEIATEERVVVKHKKRAKHRRRLQRDIQQEAEFQPALATAFLPLYSLFLSSLTISILQLGRLQRELVSVPESIAASLIVSVHLRKAEDNESE